MMTAQNELDRNAMGGTELLGARLEQHLDSNMKGWRDEFQIIRSRVRGLEEGKQKILWLHDLAEDPEAAPLMDAEYRRQFAKLVFVSHWQQNEYKTKLGIPFAEGVVIKNWIDPIKYTARPPRARQPDQGQPRRLRFVYHSTPHRGLDILVAVFHELASHFLTQHNVDLHLDVYSSFKLYGWEGRDAPFLKLFEYIRNHPRMTYHGTVPNAKIRKALEAADFFAYPSTWAETSCLCAIEAMSADCRVITSSLGALPETISGNGLVYPFSEDPQQHANEFFRVCLDEINGFITDAYRHYQSPVTHVLRCHTDGASEFQRLLERLRA